MLLNIKVDKIFILYAYRYKIFDFYKYYMQLNIKSAWRRQLYSITYNMYRHPIEPGLTVQAKLVVGIFMNIRV
jgi:hypothetical protein